jgi:hypothetical protein
VPRGRYMLPIYSPPLPGSARLSVAGGRIYDKTGEATLYQKDYLI